MIYNPLGREVESKNYIILFNALPFVHPVGFLFMHIYSEYLRSLELKTGMVNYITEIIYKETGWTRVFNVEEVVEITEEYLGFLKMIKKTKYYSPVIKKSLKKEKFTRYIESFVEREAKELYELHDEQD